MNAEQQRQQRRDRDRARADLHRTCAGGFDSIELRKRLRVDLRKLLAFDAYCINTVDPATLLITGSVGDGLPPDKTSRLFEIEYADEADVNKLRDLAMQRNVKNQIAVLGVTTGNKPESSARMREIFLPIDLAHELRAALSVGESCWGFLHLYRKASNPDFTASDVELVSSVAPLMASALRVSLLHLREEDASEEASLSDRGPDAPGIILLGKNGEIETINASAKHWLAELTDEIHHPLPHAMHAVAASVAEATPDDPWCRLRTRSGEWLIVHGSRLGEHVAIIVERARAPEIAPILLLANGFTPRERDVVALVLRGRSNDEIAGDLAMSTYTVKDHLKAIFEKAHVKSRGELVARIFMDDYAPRIARNEPIGPRGGFRT